MRLGNIILFVAFCSFTAYYVYEPLPEEIEEKWKLMLTNCFFKTLSHMVRKDLKKKPIKKNFVSTLSYFKTHCWYLRCRYIWMKCAIYALKRDFLSPLFFSTVVEMIQTIHRMNHLLNFADGDIHAGSTRLCQTLIHVLYSPAHHF